MHLLHLLKKIFSILSGGEQRRLVWLAVADVFINLADTVFLFGLLFLLNFYTKSSPNIPLASVMRRIFSVQPVLPALLFFIFFVLKNFAAFRVARLKYHFVYGIASRLSGELIHDYLHGDYNNFVQVGSAVANRRINQQPIEFSHYVVNGVQQLFSQLVLVILTFIAIILVNHWLFPLLAVLLCPAVWMTTMIMKRRLTAGGEQLKKTSELAMQQLQEALHGFVESNLYQKNDYFSKRYHRQQVKLNQYLAERLVIQYIPSRLMEVFAVFGLLMLVILNYSTTGNGWLQLTTIGALMVAAYRIIPGIVTITNTLAQLKTYSFSVDAMSMQGSRTAEASDLKEKNAIDLIQFQQVSFEWPGKPLLSKLSFELRPGDFAFVQGVSGKGKTTMLNLLLGFLNPVEGCIRINGCNSSSLKEYWSSIAYVKQTPFLLHASMGENISLHEDGFHSSQTQMVMMDAGLGPMAHRSSANTNTLVTEQGRNFSGGQRQRIAFARALYKDAAVMLLDEPFSELDPAAEAGMLKQLQQLAAGGKIIVLVSHNQAAAAFANKKICLDGN